VDKGRGLEVSNETLSNKGVVLDNRNFDFLIAVFESCYQNVSL